MKTKFFKRVMAVTMTAVMTLGIVAMRLPSGMLKAYGANDIAISEENFDARICTYLSEKHDSDSDGYIDDVSKVSLIYIDDNTTPVASLKGLEKLTNLSSLTIKYGTFTDADLTVCPNLTSVSLYMCRNMTSVNVTGLSKLDELEIDDCYSVDTVSGINNLPALTELTIEYGKITELDLTTSPNLSYVSVPGNELTTLNVAGLSKLKTLRCGYNNLTELDLTGCMAIEELGCGHNSWSSTEPLDLTKIPNVKDLDISGPASASETTTRKQITNITFPEGNKLEDVRVGGNAITNLDVSNCKYLLSLYCGDNPIESLTLDNPVLDYIYFGNVYADPDATKAFALDTSKCPALTNIYLSGNYMINAVDFTNNTLLEVVNLSTTRIKTLDLTKNTALWDLDVDGTDLTSLDLSKNTELLYLDIRYTDVQSIDLSKNTKLKTLYIGGSALTTLSLANMSSLQQLYANYSYSTDENNVLSSIDFTGCTGLTYVELESIDNLNEIDLTDCVALAELEIDLAKVLMCKLPASNTTVVIDERQSSVYLYDVEDTFDLKTIVPDIDASKIKNVKGSKEGSTVAINGTVLSGYQKYETITYQYDCGNGMVINPELYVYSFAKSENSWTTALSMEGWTYGETAKSPSAVAKYGTVTYTYSTSENGTYTSTKPSNAGTYWVKATVVESNDYYGLEAKTSFEIKKANPTYTKPTSLKALAGQKLLNVTLPTATNGVFEWANENLSVGNVGKNTFEVTFTPNDTDNYNTLTGIKVDVEVSLNENSWTTPLVMAGWTYGEAAKNPSAAATYGTPEFTYSTSENGTYTATKPSNAGTYWVKATVAETDIYEGLESAAVKFVIAKATPVYEVPTDLKALALQKLSDVQLPDGFVWETPDVVFDSWGTKTFEATFTPDDTVNYNIVENIEITIFVDRNENEWITYPSIDNWTYGETPSEPNMGEAKYGQVQVLYSPCDEDIWLEEKPETAGEYWAKFFVESDGATYYGTNNRIIGFSIKQATPTYTVPTGLSAYVGQKLSDITLPEGFSWMDETTEMTAEGTYTYKAKFTPADATNYKTVEDIDVTVEVNLYENEWTSELAIEGWTYGEEANVPSAVAKYGTVVYTYSNSANGTFTSTVPSNAGTYYVKAEVAEGASYTGLVSDAVKFVIEKATPTYTVPASLKALVGQTLADVTLSNGFAWMNDTLSVGLKGTNTFDAKFTPADILNYNIVENIKVEIVVSLNPNEWTSELTMEGWTYGETAVVPTITAKYGTPKYVYSNAEAGTFTETVPSTAGTWYVKAIVDETDVYEGLESAAVSFVIEKATPSYTVPTGSTAYVGQTLADVELPAGYAWMDDALSVGSKGTNTFKATFTPADTANYVVVENIEIAVEVLLNVNEWTSELAIEGWTYGEDAVAPAITAKYGTPKYVYSDAEAGTFTETVPSTAGTWYVKAVIEESASYTGLESEAASFVIEKATPTYTVPTGFTTYAGQTLADVELPDGFTWMDDTLSVGSKGTNTFKATFTPADTANYVVVENIEIAVEVLLNVNEWTSELTMEGWTYGETAVVPTITAKYGTPKYVYSDAEDGTFTETVPSTAGTWYVKAVIEESSSYTGLESEVASFVIEKATPTYTVPTGLTAYVGQTLADVELPEGFSWMDSTEVVNLSAQARAALQTNTYLAKYTPADTANYVVVENIEVEVAVSLNPNEWTSQLAIDGWTFGEEANVPSAVSKYGTPVFTYSDAEDGTFTEEVPVNAGTYYVKASVEGTEEYTGLESVAVEFVIAQATPDYTVPTDLKAEVGQTLADVKLPEGFAWVDDKSSVGEAGTNKFIAVFTPKDADNYKSVEVELTVTVIKVELETEPETELETETEPETELETEAEPEQDAIYTGDMSAVELWIIVMAVSMIAVLVAVSKRKTA